MTDDDQRSIPYNSRRSLGTNPIRKFLSEVLTT